MFIFQNLYIIVKLNFFQMNFWVRIICDYFKLLTMLVKAQLLKCGLCVVFYLVVCLVLINVKRNFDLKEEPMDDNVIVTERRIQTEQTPGFSRKNVDWEIDMLRMDELKGETIDLQVRN